MWTGRSFEFSVVSFEFPATLRQSFMCGWGETHNSKLNTQLSASGSTAPERLS